MIGDVHRLASVYHWSEADILALPLPRRRRYLARLDADGTEALARELGLEDGG
jgi:hypothetical protein